MKGSTLRARLELAIERALEALDKLDGDADLEAQCEDEGAACEDEGGACEDEGGQDDREPDNFETCPWPDDVLATG